MNDRSTAPADLTFRRGEAGDWPLVAGIAGQQYAGYRQLEQPTWEAWASVSEPSGYLVIAEQGGQVSGFARLVNSGAAEWWMDGPYIASGQQDTARAFLAHMTNLYNQHGLGVLRMTAPKSDEQRLALIREAGFRHTGRYAAAEAKPELADYRSFKVLQANNLEMVWNYVQRSPLYRVNHFAEHYGIFHYLNQDRLAEHLSDARKQVLGWRQFDQLHGVAILHTGSGGENNLYLNYLNAPDDTTLRAMALALRGLALKHGQEAVRMMVPLGVGLEQPLEDSGVNQVEDELWLFELPLKR